MAKKLSKAERQSWEKDLATLRAAVAQCEQVLKEDDEAEKTVGAESFGAEVRAIADGGSGDARQALRRGVLAIREAGGNSIADAAHGRDREKE